MPRHGAGGPVAVQHGGADPDSIAPGVGDHDAQVAGHDAGPQPAAQGACAWVRFKASALLLIDVWENNGPNPKSTSS